MKFKTVREGEQALVFDLYGRGELVVGPKRVFLFRKRLEILEHYTANEYQYLVIKDTVGHVIHKPGPCEMFLNRLEHESIYVRDGTKINANNVIVVYKRNPDQSVERRIIKGPVVFIPEAEEWVHEFSWHGSDPKDKTRMVPNGNKLQQVPVIPNHFYFNVRDVRTNDDVMIQVKLMLFYELTDIIQMLDTTQDPIGDLINALCADVIAFAGKLTFGEFLKQSEKLNCLDSYPQLLQRGERIGHQINKVVYTGYQATQQLQAMHDNAIQSRTQLRLNAEVHDQTQRLAEFKLSKEEDRIQQRQDMEQNKQDHQQKIQEMNQQHNLQMGELKHNEKLKQQQLESDMKLECEHAEHEQSIGYLKQLEALGVDITQYLIQQQDPRVDQEFQVARI